ncbi:ribose-phosphate pyrophosphokinase [bacterium]|nr:MAG: ribose-phosphate pyrophosphokinase [bacterium]
MIDRAPLFFALDSTRELGGRVAACLDLPSSPLEEHGFEDGEHKSRPLVSVRGRDVFVLQSLHGDAAQSPDDKLCGLLFFAGTLKDAAAARVTVIAPYLCYARQERRTRPRDPVTTRYVASLFEAVGIDRVVTLDVHDVAAFQNAFRCHTEHLEARNLLVEHFAPLLAGKAAAVVSPDAGGVKRAQRFREALARTLGREIPMVFIEKQRLDGVVTGRAVGEVAGRTAVIVDDLISTGTTLRQAARACREEGAAEVYAAATHGLFIGGAPELLADPGLARVVVTNSVPPFRLDSGPAREKVVVLDVAPLLAAAIERLHDGGSLVELLESLETPQPRPVTVSSP